MRLLIIEDEEDVRDFLRKGVELHDSSIEVMECSNGMEGVRVIAATPPDALMLDMLMPDMDGWEFLQVMDALDTKLPIVILTAVHRDNASLCGIMTSYPNVILVENKPIGIEDLGNVIDKLKKACGDLNIME